MRCFSNSWADQRLNIHCYVYRHGETLLHQGQSEHKHSKTGAKTRVNRGKQNQVTVHLLYMFASFCFLFLLLLLLVGRASLFVYIFSYCTTLWSVWHDVV